MKRKTWMISALMYAMVFMACFGVLHVLKTLMEPSGPVSVESRESGGPEGTPVSYTHLNTANPRFILTEVGVGYRFVDE